MITVNGHPYTIEEFIAALFQETGEEAGSGTLFEIVKLMAAAKESFDSWPLVNEELQRRFKTFKKDQLIRRMRAAAVVLDNGLFTAETEDEIYFKLALWQAQGEDPGELITLINTVAQAQADIMWSDIHAWVVEQLGPFWSVTKMENADVCKGLIPTCHGMLAELSAMLWLRNYAANKGGLNGQRIRNGIQLSSPDGTVKNQDVDGSCVLEDVLHLCESAYSVSTLLLKLGFKASKKDLGSQFKNYQVLFKALNSQQFCPCLDISDQALVLPPFKSAVIVYRIKLSRRVNNDDDAWTALFTEGKGIVAQTLIQNNIALVIDQVLFSPDQMQACFKFFVNLQEAIDTLEKKTALPARFLRGRIADICPTLADFHILLNSCKGDVVPCLVTLITQFMPDARADRFAGILKNTLQLPVDDIIRQAVLKALYARMTAMGQSQDGAAQLQPQLDAIHAVVEANGAANDKDPLFQELSQLVQKLRSTSQVL